MASEADNLKRLKRRHVLILNFVRKHKALWNHDDWCGFCKELEGKGLTPIDFGIVGAMLEEAKKKYLANPP